MKSNSIAAVAALLAGLAGCGQKDNVTAHTQPTPPGRTEQPKALTGEVQPAPGNPVITGSHPATPGGAPEPGQGATPPDSAAGQVQGGQQPK